MNEYSNFQLQLSHDNGVTWHGSGEYISPKKAIAAYNARPYNSIEESKKRGVLFRIVEFKHIVTTTINQIL